MEDKLKRLIEIADKVMLDGGVECDLYIPVNKKQGTD